MLVTEDERAVRDVAARILRRRGYRVLVAAGPEQAFQLVARQDPQERIDLLLTDVIMPRMSGDRLYERLVALRPDLKVLYMSGYPGDPMDIDGVDFLQKPFTVRELARRVREVLDA